MLRWLTAAVGAAAAVVLALAVAGPVPSRAASGCPLGQNDFGFGTVLVRDDGSPETGCNETIRVYCNGVGHVEVSHSFNGNAQIEETQDVTNANSPVPCGIVKKVRLYGNDTAERLDLSGVAKAGGFTGINLTNVIDGGDRRDVLIGSAFADRLVQGSDDSPGILRGGAGADNLVGDDGADTEKGGTGRDHLDGRAGPDKLYGGDGRDSLYGRDGNDLLRGGPGLDQLFGGPGTNDVRQ